MSGEQLGVLSGESLVDQRDVGTGVQTGTSADVRPSNFDEEVSATTALEMVHRAPLRLWASCAGREKLQCSVL